MTLAPTVVSHEMTPEKLRVQKVHTVDVPL